MRRGCCLGCSAVLVLVCLALFGVGYFLGRSDLVILADRVDTTRFLGDGGAVQLRIDPNQPAFVDLAQEVATDTMGLLGLMLESAFPYELGLRVRPDRGSAVADLTFALSLRRLAGLLQMRDDPELWRWLPYQRMHSVRLEREGLWVTRSTLPLHAEAIALADARWARPEGEPLRLSDEHSLELLLDNRNGALFLVAATLVQPPPLPGEWPAEQAPPMTMRELVGILERFDTLQLTADMVGEDRIEGTLTVTCEDETMAKGAALLLLLARDHSYRKLLEQGIVLEGYLERKETVITGSFVLTGFRSRTVRLVSGAGI